MNRKQEQCSYSLLENREYESFVLTCIGIETKFVTKLSKRTNLSIELGRIIQLNWTWRRYIQTVAIYEGVPKISENLNIPRKTLALRTWAAGCLFLYLSTNSLATGFFVSARVSEFWLFSLHHCHECLRLSKWRELRSKELALNFASSSTKLQLRPTEC